MNPQKRVPRARSRCTRFRVGRVSVYWHHGCWWIYYRQHDQPIRKRLGEDRAAAERVAAETNAQLLAAAPTMFDFCPLGVVELRTEFLNYHEQVLRSSLATIDRYRAATQHLVNYAASLTRSIPAHEISATGFVAYLRACLVSPNGHAHTACRPLRDKGVQFIVETCRSMYAFAQRQRHLPPYAANPFAELRIDRMRIEDAKPIFVFQADTEVQFLSAARDWEFPIHFLLAKTGLRPAELCYLLLEDLDLRGGWLYVRNKPELGWSVKTRNERMVPLHPVLRDVLHHVVQNRKVGVVFRRPKYAAVANRVDLDRAGLLARLRQMETVVSNSAKALGARQAQQKLAKLVWQEAGALDPDQIRNSMIRIARRCGLGNVTCPKSWRHSFATLMQDANVDPLLRQITLGHQPSGAHGALGMTSVYTHSRPTTHAHEILRAIDLWPRSLELAQRWLQQLVQINS